MRFVIKIFNVFFIISFGVIFSWNNIYGQGCNGSDSIQNGGFEAPYLGGPTMALFHESLVPHWKTTATDTLIEIWGSGFNGVPAFAGNQFAEINATQAASLYQDLATVPCTQLTWSVAHRGRTGIDTMGVYIGPPSTTVLQMKCGTGTSWQVYTGIYIIPPGQTLTRFEFKAIYASSGIQSVGNFIDDVKFYCSGNGIVVNSPIICNGETATITASGGTSYLWNTGQTTSSINVSPTTTTFYTVAAETGTGCSIIDTITVTVKPSPDAQIISHTDALCGSNNGTATATGGGSYLWNTSPPQSNATAINLPAGVYIVTVTGSNNCISTTSVTIGQSGGTMVSVQSVTDAICGQSNGSITTTVSGGTPPYTFTWNSLPAQFTQNLQNVSPGNYIVTITSANGCSATVNATVGQTGGPILTMTATNEMCGHKNGTAKVNATGDSGNYTYQWSCNPPQTNMIASGLKAGVYTVTVTDGNCNVTDSVSVSDTPGATAEFSANPSIISIIDDIPISFNGSTTGNIATWQWNFGDGSADANGQFVDHQYSIIGTYIVTLITVDNNGCLDTITGTVKVKDIFTFYIPNAFSPNDDQLNDVFTPQGTNVDTNNFEMFIFNRWGNLLFHTNKWYGSQAESWNGTLNNSGSIDDIIMDTYVYRIFLKEINGPEHEYIGKVTIIE